MRGRRAKQGTRDGWLAVAMFCLAALSCRTAPPATDSDPMALRGVDFRADVEVERDATPTLEGTITIHNRRPTPASLNFPVACYGLLRAYEGDVQTVAAWEQSADECPEEPVRLNLMPDEERTISLAAVEVGSILESGLAPGTYRFTVVVAPDGQVLEIEAGEEELRR